MARVKIEFDIDNDYYRNADGTINYHAVQSTINIVAYVIEQAPSDIRDGNGNTVGTFEVVED